MTCTPATCSRCPAAAPTTTRWPRTTTSWDGLRWWRSLTVRQICWCVARPRRTCYGATSDDSPTALELSSRGRCGSSGAVDSAELEVVRSPRPTRSSEGDQRSNLVVRTIDDVVHPTPGADTGDPAQCLLHVVAPLGVNGDGDLGGDASSGRRRPEPDGVTGDHATAFEAGDALLQRRGATCSRLAIIVTDWRPLPTSRSRIRWRSSMDAFSPI